MEVARDCWQIEQDLKPQLRTFKEIDPDSWAEVPNPLPAFAPKPATAAASMEYLFPLAALSDFLGLKEKIDRNIQVCVLKEDECTHHHYADFL